MTTVVEIVSSRRMGVDCWIPKGLCNQLSMSRGVVD